MLVNITDISYLLFYYTVPADVCAMFITYFGLNIMID